MNLQLDNQLALVSASTKGIGFAIARSLAREGARVIINGRSAASVDDAVKRLLADVPGAKLEKFPGDLADAAVATKLAAAFPQVDILVNNLGIFDPKPFAEIPDAEWPCRCSGRLNPRPTFVEDDAISGTVRPEGEASAVLHIPPPLLPAENR